MRRLTGCRRAGVVYGAPILCATVALGALLWGADLRRQGPDAERGLLADDPQMPQVELDASAPLSSTAAFLSDLEGRAGGQGADGAAVAWREEGGLIETASAVLEQYRMERSALLATSGYLDLFGRVWGAVLQDGSSWVDVVLVATDDDASTAVRIVRLEAPGETEGEGG